jgi:hypothetical protein
MAGDAVPGQPRTQLGKLVRRIAARQQVQHALERRCEAIRKTARLDAPSDTARRPRPAPRRPWRPAAEPARPADCAGSAWPRPRPPSSAERRRRRRAGRRGTWEKRCPTNARRLDAPLGPPAESRTRPTAAPRSGSPDRRRPCRSPTPATTWRRSPAIGLVSSGLRSAGECPWRSSRDEPTRSPRPPPRSPPLPDVRPGGGC